MLVNALCNIYTKHYFLSVARGTLREIQILRRYRRLPASNCEYFCDTQYG